MGMGMHDEESPACLLMGLAELDRMRRAGFFTHPDQQHR